MNHKEKSELEEFLDEATVSRLKEYIRTTECILHERNRVLRAIPECPMHGNGCVPHALDWIDKQMSGVARCAFGARQSADIETDVCDLPATLAAIRKGRNLTQVEVAEENVSLTQPLISDYERGAQGVDSLKKIDDLLGVYELRIKSIIIGDKST